MVRAIDDASAAWWSRHPPEWTDDEALLAAGCCIVARARAAVRETLRFSCSAGIAANKLLAKLCGGLHKPGQQTTLPPSAVRHVDSRTHAATWRVIVVSTWQVCALLDPLPVDRLRGFGGKLGDLLRSGRPELGLDGYSTCGELRLAGKSAATPAAQHQRQHRCDTGSGALTASLHYQVSGR